MTDLPSRNFMPHGHCYLWSPDVLWLNVGSDALIALSYYSIPLTLLYFTRRRIDLEFRVVFVLFSAFIFACGTTHLMEIWTTWDPVYRLQGLVKLATGLVSAATALVLIPIVPKALALQSPAALAAANARLTEEITRRSAAEIDLRVQRDYHERLLSLAPVLVVVLDERAVVARANRYAEQICGCGADELNRQGLTSRMPAAAADAFVKWLGELEGDDSSRNRPITVAFQAGTGEVRQIEWQGRILPQEGPGASLTLLCVGTDVTEAQRSAELQRAKERAESASQARQEIVAKVSHDLRTPLNIIIGYNEMLRDTPLADGQRDLVTRSNHAAENLRHLINDLLDASSFGSRGLRVAPRPMSLRAAVADAVEMIVARANAKGLMLNTQFEEGLQDAVIGDPARLEQILINLMDNAVKYTIEGSITVEVLSDTQPDCVHFIVRDTGIGIPAADQMGVFDAFVQGELGQAVTAGGVGLGLTISRQLVELLGGRLWLESEPSRGSAFHFILPLPKQGAGEMV